MLDTRELYEDCKEGEWDDYHPITDSIGKILVEVDDKAHATSFILYKSNESVPMLGVLVLEKHQRRSRDPLGTCKTWRELQGLAEAIQRSVAWFDNINDCIDYLVFDIPASDGFYTEKKKVIEFVKTSCSILKGKKEISEVICNSPWNLCSISYPPRNKLLCVSGQVGGKYLCYFARKKTNSKGKPEYFFKCKNLSREIKGTWWMEITELPKEEDA